MATLKVAGAAPVKDRLDKEGRLVFAVRNEDGLSFIIHVPVGHPMLAKEPTEVKFSLSA